MGDIRKVETACLELLDDGREVVKSRTIAHRAGVSDVSWVGSLLFFEIDSENPAFDRIRVEKVGESKGSANWRLRIDDQ